MKSLSALFLLSALSMALSAQSSYLKFREDGWSSEKSCQQCIVCNEKPSDVVETQKTIAFYCGETLIGTWQLTKLKLAACDSVYYQTNCFGKDGMGLSTFATDEEAIGDICREVRFYCPGALEIRRIESPHTDYSLNFIRDFFSYKLYTAQDKSAKQTRATPVLADEGEEIFKVTDQMPRFPGCEEIAGTDVEKKQCADKKMLEFVYGKLIYPAEARAAGLEGTVVITFVIETDGSISDAQIVRDIGKGCGVEARRVVNLMKEEGIRWVPGHQHGKPVRVQFNMPVKFIIRDGLKGK